MEDITQIQNLLNGGTGSNGSFDIGQMIMWFVVPTVILTIVVSIAFIVAGIRRWQMEKAIYEIRDLLREVRDIQKQQLKPPTPAYPQPATEQHETKQPPTPQILGQ